MNTIKNDLPTAAQRLEEIASDIRMRMRRTVEDLISVGNSLIEAKGILGHGKFGKWCEVAFPDMNRETRSKLMQVAERFGNVRISDKLSASVYQVLASKSVPESVVRSLIDRAEQGEKIDVAAAKDAVRKHRGIETEEVSPEEVIARGRAAWEALRDPLEGKASLGLIPPDALKESKTPFGKGGKPWSRQAFERTVRYVFDRWRNDGQDTEYPSESRSPEEATEELEHKLIALGIVSTSRFITDVAINNPYLEHLHLVLLIFVADNHGRWTDFTDLCLEAFQQHRGGAQR